MQAQDSGFDWSHLLTWSLGIVGGGISGLVGSAWRWGRAIDEKVSHVREEFQAEIASVKRSTDVRLDEFVDQVKETMEGTRRQIDDDRLNAERRFLTRDDFKTFLDEYRDDRKEWKADFRELKQNISKIIGERN